MINKIVLVTICSFGITFLVNVFILASSNLEGILISPLSLLVFLLVLFFMKLEGKLEGVRWLYDPEFSFGTFLFYRVIFCVSYIFMVQNLSLIPSLDLTNKYSNYIMIDDREYVEDYAADSESGPYGGSGSDASGYYSTIKYFVKEPINKDGFKLPQGIVEKSEDDKYYIDVNNDGELTRIYFTECWSKEYAHIKGYVSFPKEANSMNKWLTPFMFFIEVMIRDGIYTLLFVFFVLVLNVMFPGKVFKAASSKA